MKSWSVPKRAGFVCERFLVWAFWMSLIFCFLGRNHSSRLIIWQHCFLAVYILPKCISSRPRSLKMKPKSESTKPTSLGIGESFKSIEWRRSRWWRCCCCCWSIAVQIETQAILWAMFIAKCIEKVNKRFPLKANQIG